MLGFDEGTLSEKVARRATHPRPPRLARDLAAPCCDLLPSGLVGCARCAHDLPDVDVECAMSKMCGFNTSPD